MANRLCLLIVLIASCRVEMVASFREWNYSITETESYPTWRQTWSLISDEDAPRAPRPRRGHSVVVAGDLLIMFGGRGNEADAVHIPKTYNVEKINGTIEFTTYEDKPVSPCFDKDNIYFTKEEQEEALCTGNESAVVVGTFYNDVWSYDLKCNRYFDGPCEGTGWTIMHPGALEGGCNIQLGIEVCTVPSERYNHGSVYFEDGTMYVYGGFSQRCADYCDDIWMFDIYLKSWRQVYAAEQLSKLDGFVKEGEIWGGPGKRWRHSMVNAGNVMAVFGGHRIWHGFAFENTEDNDWLDYTTYPKGGYLDDFWVYTKILDETTVDGSDYKTSEGSWVEITVKEECYLDPGESWEERLDESCINIWPPGRAGHATVLDTERNLLWLFGGYTTYYPYLSTDGFGSSQGANSKGEGGFVPFPGYDYYLNDMWYYNFSSGYWLQVNYGDDVVPDGRVDHIMLATEGTNGEDIIFMHGGFSNNHFYDDVWYFTVSTMKWLEKKEFVYPKYPDSCTDDIEFIESNPNCTEMSWPKHLERDINYPYAILPPEEQKHYYPDADYGAYYNIFIKDRDSSENMALYGPIRLDEESPMVGTAMFPFAASAPQQYVRPFVYDFNNTRALLLQRCTSVFAEPTRGKIADGLFGRSNGSLFIPQPRRQRPGWDGCRDRQDRNPDLPAELQYQKPYGRANHRAVWVPQTKEIIMYGGRSFLQEQPASITYTWPSRVVDDMWYFRYDICINNCSLHGDCYNGFCLCYVGYFGVDCSNISCPGTYCYVDSATYQQVCTHACHAGYNHTDNDKYVTDIRKTPCSEELPGEVNGICDGFGVSQCAPPFIGDDCSIKDCKNNCSFNGWCSVEYPVSRCMCNPGYFGEICEEKYCLNNCSYPNGVCNTTSGSCNCRMMYSPYNRSRPYKPWDGEDCSYIFAYAAAPYAARPNTILVGLVSVLTSFLVLWQKHVSTPWQDRDK